MSFKTVTVHGVGFCFTCKRPEHLVQFLENHKDSFFKLANSKYSKDDLQNLLAKAITLKENYLEYLESNKDEPASRTEEPYDFLFRLDVLFEELSGNIGCEEGIGTIIACIMKEETEIGVDYFRGEEDVPVIMLSYACPWEFTQKEREITYDYFHAVCKRYYHELGISEDDAEFGDQEVVYCG